MRTDITKINEKTPHDCLTEGLMVFNGGTSKLFKTGEWRTNTPVSYTHLDVYKRQHILLQSSQV